MFKYKKSAKIENKYNSDENGTRPWGGENLEKNGVHLPDEILNPVREYSSEFWIRSDVLDEIVLTESTKRIHPDFESGRMCRMR